MWQINTREKADYERERTHPGGNRRQREEREIIAGLFAEFEPDTLRLLEATADMVRKDYIKGGTAIKLAENVTAKFKVKDGTVIVTRSEKHEHQHSL